VSLARWTGGLVGERDPAQPLLTLVVPEGRVELSGATTANWVAKNANLLVDGLGGPAQVGLLLPLHWQTVALLLAGVAGGATVVVAAAPEDLAGADAAFTTVDRAQAVLDAGAGEVLAVSTHPLGAPGPPPPPLVLDHAREVPGHGDHWPGGPAVGVVVGAAPADLPDLGLTGADRVLVDVDPADAAGLRGLLAVLHAGAAAVLVPGSAALDLAAVARQEGVTAGLGTSVPGVRALDG
jgi:uncharacterized protein (TIGR03089 family)